MKRLVAFCLLFAICSIHCTDVHLDGLLAETKVLPLRLDCHRPYQYIYIGGITFNGTEISEDLYSAVTTECKRQLEVQKGRGGQIVSCYLSFGKGFSTQDTGMVRAVYKCTTSEQDKAPGGKDWQKHNERSILTALPNGRNQVIFRCPGIYEMVVLEKILQEGEVLTAGFEKRKLNIMNECYREALQKQSKGEKGAMHCTYQLSAEEAADAEFKYRCSEPPATPEGSTKYL